MQIVCCTEETIKLFKILRFSEMHAKNARSKQTQRGRRNVGACDDRDPVDGLRLVYDNVNAFIV